MARKLRTTLGAIGTSALFSFCALERADLVHLEVDPDGVPKTARMEPEFRVFKDAVEGAGLSWRFSPDHGRETRRVTLTFLFQLVDESAAPAERCSLFRAPYEVVVHKALKLTKRGLNLEEVTRRASLLESRFAA
jgi:hypothetical protein